MSCPSMGPNNFGQVQIVKISPEKPNLNLTKMNWTQPEHFVSIQNQDILDGPKLFWIHRRTRHKEPFNYYVRTGVGRWF